VLGCDPNVVDAVRDPLPAPAPEPSEQPTQQPDPPPKPPNPLESSLIHRYSFDGTGTAVIDSRGAAHGQLVGAKLSGKGNVVLAGERSGQYVNLPNGIISGLVNATFESWLTWKGGAAWQRLFDFGNSSAGEDAAGTGTSYLFLAASVSHDTARQINGGLRITYSQNGINNEDGCEGPMPLPTDAATHVAVVVDHDAGTLALYQDGALLNTCPLTRALSAIDDVNDWIGHSNFSADADLAATYDEFRIYDAALSAEQIADSFRAGPKAGR
jgi:hypothetical protein